MMQRHHFAKQLEISIEQYLEPYPLTSNVNIEICKGDEQDCIFISFEEKLLTAVLDWAEPFVQFLSEQYPDTKFSLSDTDEGLTVKWESNYVKYNEFNLKNRKMN